MRKKSFEETFRTAVIVVSLAIMGIAFILQQLGNAGLGFLHSFGAAVSETAEENIIAQEPVSSFPYAWEETGWAQVADIGSVSDYDGTAAFVLNGNKPYFTETEIMAAYEGQLELSDKDERHRVGPATALICRDLMPDADEERGAISEVYPTGWAQHSYDFIDNGWLYNRCHIIGWQLCGLNAESRNLMTGTRYFNTEGMLPYENDVASYVRRTDNHVLYRVTPVFFGAELLARGVVMEAYSLEDEGAGVCFCAYCYNVQPGVDIDYKSGESQLAANAQLGAAA